MAQIESGDQPLRPLTMAAVKYTEEAARRLALSHEPLSERLACAALALVSLRAEQLPEGDLREAFEHIHARITAVAGPEGKARASVAAMADDEQWELVGLILDLAVAVATESGRRDALVGTP